MGKKSAPKYATTTYSTDGLFGSATSSKKGTSFTGEDWQNTMGNTGANLINTSLGNMLSNDYAKLLMEDLSGMLHKKVKVRLVHDGTANALYFSEIENSVCVSLGTAFGVGFTDIIIE